MQCDICGSADAEEMIDPLILGLEGREEMIVLCESCASEASEDV